MAAQAWRGKDDHAESVAGAGAQGHENFWLLMVTKRLPMGGGRLRNFSALIVRDFRFSICDARFVVGQLAPLRFAPNF